MSDSLKKIDWLISHAPELSVRQFAESSLPMLMELDNDHTALKHAVRRMLRAEDGSRHARRRYNVSWSDEEVAATKTWFYGWNQAYAKYRKQIEELIA